MTHSPLTCLTAGGLTSTLVLVSNFQPTMSGAPGLPHRHSVQAASLPRR